MSVITCERTTVAFQAKNMDPVTKSVTLAELGRLPLRALVAIATRCARRVEPCLRIPLHAADAGSFRNGITSSLEAAESFVRGQPNDPMTLRRLATTSAEIAEACQEHGEWAAYATAHAIRAAAAANEVKDRADAAALMEVVCATYGAGRVLFAAYSRVPADLVLAAMRADHDTLAKLELGAAAETGRAVDPSEQGPLGVLWPAGRPEID